MKILLVEEDPSIRELLSTTLSAHSYTVDLTNDGQTALNQARAYDYDLIISDVCLPNLDGLSLCRQLRQQGDRTPILLLTSENSHSDIVTGLDAGADDYVTKPFDLSELMARVRALLRRGDLSLTPAILTWGELRLNPIAAEVTYGKKLLSLTPKEYGLLELFLRNPQRVFSRSAILDRIWSSEISPVEGTVTNHIKALRHKLKAAGMNVDMIETVYGLGYRLKAPPEPDQPLELAQISALETLNLSPRVSILLAITPNKKLIEQLQATASRWGVKLESVSTLASATAAIALHSPHLILLHLSESTRLPEALPWLQRLKEYNDDLPVLVLAEQDNFRDRIAISRLGPYGFLCQPVSAQQIFQALSQLLPPAHPNDPKVMIVDDDGVCLDSVSYLLPPWGVQVIQLKEPDRFWDVLNATHPDLLILNLEMLKFSGLHLCQVVRQDPKWGNLPILALTAYTDAESIQRAFAAGVDDFVSKPVVGPEIVTRVVSRLERVRVRPGVKQSQEFLANPLQAIASSSPQWNTQSYAIILLVDDEPDNLRVLSKILSGQGYKIRKAISGQLAIESVLTSPPDLILLDIKMPQMDGYEVCATLKAWESSRDIPVIFLSALDDTADKMKAFALGGVDYITKPFQADEVLARIKHQLLIVQQKKQLAEQNRQLQRVKEILQESEECFRSAFNHAAIGMALIGLDNRWLQVNPALCKMLGYSTAQLLSLTIPSLIHPEDIETYHYSTQQMFATQTGNCQMKLRYFCQSKKIICFLINLSIVQSHEGIPLYYVGQFQELSKE